MDNKEFGRKLRVLRKSKGYTQEALAELAGIDAKHLSRLENGRYFPAYSTLDALVKILDVNIGELINIEPAETQINDNPIYIKILQILNTADSNEELSCYLDAVKAINKTLNLKKNR